MSYPKVVHWEWPLKLASKLNGFEVSGIEFIPGLIIVKKDASAEIINHEKIHARQMLETLFVGFYLLYTLSYLWLRRKHSHKDAYLQIPFEVEAYSFSSDPSYLHRRPFFAWAFPKKPSPSSGPVRGHRLKVS